MSPVSRISTRRAATIQVDLEQTNPELITDRQRPMLTADPSYFNTQLQLLNSDALLRRVVKEHKLDTNPDFQRAKAENATSAWRSMLRAVGLARDEVKRDVKTGEIGSIGPNSTLISADEIAEAVRLAPYVEIIKKNLNTEPVRESRVTVKDTRLIEVTYTNTDPELASFVANGICETFTNYNQEKRSGTSRKTSDFLQSRINDLQSEVRTDEIKLVELQKQYGIVPTTNDQTIEIERLAGLNKEKLTAELARTNAEAELLSVKNEPEKLKSLVAEKLGRFITEKENSIVNYRNDTEKKIAELQSERAKRLEVFHEGADPVKEVDTQIASLQTSLTRVLEKNNTEINEYRSRAAGDILNNLQTVYFKTRDNETKIRAAYDEQYAKAQSQNSGAVTIKLLEQNLEANKGFLKQLQEQQSGNDVASQGSGNNISVAGFAIPNEVPGCPSPVDDRAGRIVPFDIVRNGPCPVFRISRRHDPDGRRDRKCTAVAGPCGDSDDRVYTETETAPGRCERGRGGTSEFRTADLFRFAFGPFRSLSPAAHVDTAFDRRPSA